MMMPQQIVMTCIRLSTIGSFVLAKLTMSFMPWLRQQYQVDRDQTADPNSQGNCRQEFIADMDCVSFSRGCKSKLDTSQTGKVPEVQAGRHHQCVCCTELIFWKSLLRIALKGANMI
jgi:hypothetical protein